MPASVLHHTTLDNAFILLACAYVTSNITECHPHVTLILASQLY